MTPIKIAIIEWQDTSHYPGHHSLEDIEEMAPMAMKTAGWLVAQTDEHLLIAQTIGTTKAADVLCIPIGVITDIVMLEDAS